MGCYTKHIKFRFISLPPCIMCQTVWPYRHICVFHFCVRISCTVPPMHNVCNVLRRVFVQKPWQVLHDISKQVYTPATKLYRELSKTLQRTEAHIFYFKYQKTKKITNSRWCFRLLWARVRFIVWPTNDEAVREQQRPSFGKKKECVHRSTWKSILTR